MFMQLAALSMERQLAAENYSMVQPAPIDTSKHHELLLGPNDHCQRYGRSDYDDVRLQPHLQFPLNIKTESMDMLTGQGSPLGYMGNGTRQTGYPPLVSSPGSMGSTGSDSYGGMSNQTDTNDSVGKGGRTRKLKEDKYCGVCGDRALGYNFDAISCESCKAFFRRNALKTLDYFKCPYDEKCKMDISNRRFCKRCRLKKCFEIGMRKEYILTEDEKMRKRQKIEENSMRQQTGIMDRNHIGYQRDMEKRGLSTPPRNLNSQSGEVSSSQPRRVLTQDDIRSINEIVQAYKTSLEVSVEVSPSREKSNCMADLVNIAELSVRRVIDMSKKIKSFKALSQADQISLLKGGSIELLIIRSVITYDKEKEQFLDPTDNESQAMTTDQLQKAEGGLFEDHMKFVRSLAIDLQADETTLIMLLVISLFSPDRPNLLDKHGVCAEQENYSILLKCYLESKYPYHVAKSIYPRLLMKLVDIRNLNEEHSAVLVKVNPEGIQPLMIELLDLRQ